jgi:hypothetical protein
VCVSLVLLGAARSRTGSLERSVENGGDWYARSPGWYTARGLYPTEHAPDGSAFAWAGGRVRLQIPRLDRDVKYTLGLRVRSGRSSADPPAVLRVVVDGLDAAAATVGPEWEEIAIPLPIAKQPGAVVLIDAQQTFTPGPQDPRGLAFMIDRLVLTPRDSKAIPLPTGVLVHVALFAAGVALAALICGFPAWLSSVTGTAAGLAATWLVLLDSAFLGQYSAALPALAAIIVAWAAPVSLVSRRAAQPMRWAWPAAAFIAGVVTVLRLAVFLHPAAPVSDAMFHVHRAQAVRAGEYIFTSVTPRPFYEFPYPVGLYVAAQPFWEQAGDRVFLLRVIALVADALVALALFSVVAARWTSPRTGLVAAGIALSVPVVVHGVSTANLTNIFAQSCFSLGILWIAWRLPSGATTLSVAGAVGLLSAAFLSHFSTAVIGAPAAVLVAVACALARDPREARAWRWVTLSVLLALSLSYVVYYSHFHEVYARTLSRVGTEGADTSFVATVAEHSESKAVTMMRFLVVTYGWGALLLAVAGAAAAVKRGWREGWTLVLAALAVTVASFLVLGALTPIEMRATLAAHPVVASLAALGAGWLWHSNQLVLRAIAVAGLGWTLWAGIAALKAALV